MCPFCTKTFFNLFFYNALLLPMLPFELLCGKLTTLVLFFFLDKRQIKFGSLKVFFLLPPNKKRNKENSKKKTLFERFKRICRRNGAFVALLKRRHKLSSLCIRRILYAWGPPKFWYTRRVLTVTSRRIKAFHFTILYLYVSKLDYLCPTNIILICGSKHFLNFFHQIQKEPT